MAKDVESVIGVDFQTVKTATPPVAGFKRIQVLDTTGFVSVAPDGTTAALGGGVVGAVASVVAGPGVSVNNADPANPIVSDTPGTRTTVAGAAAQDLDSIAVDGDVDGDIEFYGQVKITAAGSYTIRANGLTTNQQAKATSVGVSAANVADLRIADAVGPATDTDIVFWGRMFGKSTDAAQGFVCNAFVRNAGSGTTGWETFGAWIQTGTHLLKLTLHGPAAGSLGVGSFIRVVKTGRTG